MNLARRLLTYAPSKELKVISSIYGATQQGFGTTGSVDLSSGITGAQDGDLMIASVGFAANNVFLSTNGWSQLGSKNSRPAAKLYSALYAEGSLTSFDMDFFGNNRGYLASVAIYRNAQIAQQGPMEIATSSNFNFPLAISGPDPAKGEWYVITGVLKPVTASVDDMTFRDFNNVISSYNVTESVNTSNFNTCITNFVPTEGQPVMVIGTYEAGRSGDLHYTQLLLEPN